MIITEFLQKQVERAIQTIHMYSEEFASHFFDALEAQAIREEKVNIYATLGLGCFYVQRYSKDDGSVRESEVEFKDYNEWYRGLTG